MVGRGDDFCKIIAGISIAHVIRHIPKKTIDFCERQMVAHSHHDSILVGSFVQCRQKASEGITPRA